MPARLASRSGQGHRSIAWLLGAATLIALVFLALRLRLALTPPLAETYYDEALTGLMSLAILHGIPQMFYWGQPYLGPIDAYVAAAGFWLFGASTLVLRMVTVTVSVLWAWALWQVGRRAAGEGFGLLAGLYVAVPPVFLTYVQLSSHGENMSMTLGALVLAAAAWLMDADAGRRARMAAWGVLGVAGGLGWWASPMMGMFLVAAAVAILVARPRTLRAPGPYAALALFFVTSLPFWIWNLRHEWATFWHLLTWKEGEAPASVVTRVTNMSGTLLASIDGSFWDGRAIALPPPVRLLDRAVLLAVYAPCVVLAAGRAGTWARRLARRERPLQDALDLVVLAFWLTVAANLATWFGTSGILRYAMTFYATLPVLCAVALARVARLGRAGRVAALVLAAALLGYNLLTNALFVEQTAAMPWRPVDAAIARLRALGIRACYADSRIAQVVTFESGERIVCADYEGYRNFAFLQQVDAIDDPSAVAIVTHRVLRLPTPSVMAQTLGLMGAGFQRDEVGDYVIFHHFRPPDPRVRPIPPAGWSARTSVYPELARFAFDRQVWTRWAAPKTARAWFELDLGRVHRLAQLALEAGPFPFAAPVGLRVETSVDGRSWDRVATVRELLDGDQWWKGHPRFDDTGDVLVRMTPREARYVRLTQTGADGSRALWSLGEIFAYEVADTPWTPPAAAVADYAAADRELAHWMDDPAGPVPKRAPVTFEHRRAQVRWGRVFETADRALGLAPEWEAAHRLYARALALSGWWEQFDLATDRAASDQAWPEVLRWAALADARSPGFWRSGREAARAEALTHLGRLAEAAAARTAAARRLAGPVAVRFGGEIELDGVELPAQARPGERVTVRYAWQALRQMRTDYTAFVHVAGAGGEINGDYLLGSPSYGTTRWAPGERTEQTVALDIPRDAAPGTYHVKIGVWAPTKRTRLPVTASDLPRRTQYVIAGTLTIAP